MRLKTDMDYVEFYAEQLTKDPKLFEQHRMLIESQMKSSEENFRNWFGTGEEFKLNARKYLRAIGILK